MTGATGHGARCSWTIHAFLGCAVLRILPCFVMGVAVLSMMVPAWARESTPPSVRNVRIWFGEVDGATGDAPLSLQVAGGGRTMFTSKPKPPADAHWRHSIRVFTRNGQPLVFRLLRGVQDENDLKRWAPPRVSPGRIERDQRAIRRQDQLLAQGFEDLVGDFDQPEARNAVERELVVPSRVPDFTSSGTGRSLAPTVICSVSLAWPPEDGQHRLACGAMHLVIRTKRLPDDSR